MDAYEVQISLSNDSNRYYVEHRFGMLPANDTVALLLNEAKGAFLALYGADDEYCSIGVVHLDTMEEIVSAPVPEQRT